MLLQTTLSRLSYILAIIDGQWFCVVKLLSRAIRILLHYDTFLCSMRSHIIGEIHARAFFLRLCPILLFTTSLLVAWNISHFSFTSCNISVRAGKRFVSLFCCQLPLPGVVDWLHCTLILLLVFAESSTSV